jgi:hypothetical protein
VLVSEDDAATLEDIEHFRDVIGPLLESEVVASNEISEIERLIQSIEYDWKAIMRDNGDDAQFLHIPIFFEGDEYTLGPLGVQQLRWEFAASKRQSAQLDAAPARAPPKRGF